MIRTATRIAVAAAALTLATCGIASAAPATRFSLTIKNTATHKVVATIPMVLTGAGAPKVAVQILSRRTFKLDTTIAKGSRQTQTLVARCDGEKLAVEGGKGFPFIEMVKGRPLSFGVSRAIVDSCDPATTFHATMTVAYSWVGNRHTLVTGTVTFPYLLAPKGVATGPGSTFDHSTPPPADSDAPLAPAAG